MKALKYLGIVLVVLVVLVGGILAWLFSASGNEFLKNKITQIANEKAPIELSFEYFKLGWNSYAFSLSDKAKSQVAIEGSYSLLTLNTQAKITGVIKDLAPYENLIGMKLNGGLSLNGDLTKQSNNLALKADIGAFESHINVDIGLKNYQPQRLFITSTDGIKLESLLHFLNQPQYASGQIALKADMNIQDIKNPQGGFQIASKALSPNLSLLSKEYGIILPKDALSFLIEGEVKEESLINKIVAQSSYLSLASNNLQINLKDYHANGEIVGNLKNITASGFNLKENLAINLALKAQNIANQNALLTLATLNQPFKVNLEIPQYSPKTIQITGEKLDIASLLKFASLPYDAAGNLDFKADITRIDLDKGAFSLKGDLQSAISHLNYEKMAIAKDNKLNANFSGNEKEIAVNMTSDLFDSNFKGFVALEQYAPKTANIEASNLNLQKLAGLLGYDMQGILNLKSELKNFKDNQFDGNFKADSPKLLISQKTLNELSGMSFKKDLEFTLRGEGNFKKGVGEAKVDLNSKDLNLKIFNTKIDLQKQNYSTDFAFSTPQIANINPLDLTLKGALSLEGSVGIEGDNPLLKITTSDFGTPLNVQLQNQKLTLQAQKLDIHKIATFVDNDKMIKGGELHLDSNLVIKGNDSKTILKNLQGNFQASVQKLELYGVDIDALASSYESANSLSLLDVGAFVLAGPLGIAATKGGSLGFSGLNSVVSAKTLIRQLEANFDINKGIANAKDVAFATGKTRIAAKGAINLNNNNFENFSIALLDEKNCAKYAQQIKGTLDNPKIEITQTTIDTAVNLATSLLGEITKNAKKAVEPVLKTPSTQCSVFYQGVVKP